MKWVGSFWVMFNLRFDSVLGQVTLGVRVKIGCFHFGCRFGFEFGLFGSGFGSVLPGLYVCLHNCFCMLFMVLCVTVLVFDIGHCPLSAW